MRKTQDNRDMFANITMIIRSCVNIYSLNKYLKELNANTFRLISVIASRLDPNC
jgi:hypothetical protein